MNAARTPDTETLSTRDRELVERFDAGLLNDFGGGNVGWWWEYIRSLLDRADEHYREQAADRLEALLSTRGGAPDARPDVETIMAAIGSEAMRRPGEGLVFSYGQVERGIRAALAPKERSE